MLRRLNWTLLAWRLVPRLPEWLVVGAFRLVAVAVWTRRGKAVRQLERNLTRVRPGLSARRRRRLVRAGLTSYLRYFAEVFLAHRLSPEQIDARIRVVHPERLFSATEGGHKVVLALGHMGNWDFAGSWAARAVGPVVTTAERLEPPEVFEHFVHLRARLGIDIVPADPGQVFRPLLRFLRAPGAGIVPLLADRDLSRRGVEVLWFGEPARLAAGPAALARQAGVPLVPLAIRSERLTGRRRRAAGSPHGYVLEALPPVPRYPDLPPQAEVEAMTQAWAHALGEVIAKYPADWHMLQKVFVADLDPAKDSRVRGVKGAD
jgi:KDO2-lipid IV(A) lauroyltransferase